MVARGRVKNGVVVFDENASLPEGQEVLVATQGPTNAAKKRFGHSVLDIAPVSVGKILVPFTSRADLLDEMLEGRT